MTHYAPRNHPIHDSVNATGYLRGHWIRSQETVMSTDWPGKGTLTGSSFPNFAKSSSAIR